MGHIVELESKAQMGLGITVPYNISNKILYFKFYSYNVVDCLYNP